MFELWGWVGVRLTKCLRKSGEEDSLRPMVVSVLGLQSVQSTLVRYMSQRRVALLTATGKQRTVRKGLGKIWPQGRVPSGLLLAQLCLLKSQHLSKLC